MRVRSRSKVSCWKVPESLMKERKPPSWVPMMVRRRSAGSFSLPVKAMRRIWTLAFSWTVSQTSTSDSLTGLTW